MSVVGGPRPLDDGAVNDSSDSALALAATAPFEDFQQASDAVLELLQSRFPMGLWMVTRTVEDDWVVLQASDRSYGVTGGDHFRWSDSFCYRMVRGEGPNVAADSSSVPAYAQAPIGRDIPIAAYIGYPLLADGQLFGTLCAIDPQVRPDRSDDEPLIRLLARLLSTVLESQLHATQLSEMAAELMDSAHRDPLTRLLNRRGWERLVTQAQENLTMLGIRQCVVIVDLDGLKNLNDTAGHAAGDDVLQRTAAALGGSTRGATSLPGSAGTSSQSCSRNRTLWNRLSSCNDWRRHWWMPMSQPRSAGLSAEQASVLPRLWHRQTRGCTSKSACVAVCDGCPS